MRRGVLAAVVAVQLAGCWFGVRGGVDATLSGPDDAASAPQGAFDIGGYGADDEQLAMLGFGVGVSPMVGAGDASEPRRMPIFSFVGRYERAFSARRPWLRGYGRLTLGGNLCSGGREEMEDPDATCTSEEAQRSIGVTSIGLGVAMTATAEHRRDHDLAPPVGSLGIALVYTYASDEYFGAGDFVGLEVSAAFGVDLFSSLLNAEND